MNGKISRYLVDVFVPSWLLWGILIVLTQFHFAPFTAPLSMVLFVLGGSMPPLAEIYLQKKYETGPEFRAFLRNIIDPKQALGWYVISVGSAFLCCFLPYLLGGAARERPLYFAFLLFPVMVFGGGLEEIGWRGFLQPALQKRFSALVSTLLVGVIWACWHLPLWLVPGSGQYNMNFMYFSITALALSFILAAIYNATRSIFLCIVLHSFMNSFWAVYVPNGRILPSCATLAFGAAVFAAVTLLAKRRHSAGHVEE